MLSITNPLIHCSVSSFDRASGVAYLQAVGDDAAQRLLRGLYGVAPRGDERGLFRVRGGGRGVPRARYVDSGGVQQRRLRHPEPQSNAHQSILKENTIR